MLVSGTSMLDIDSECPMQRYPPFLIFVQIFLITFSCVSLSK